MGRDSIYHTNLKYIKRSISLETGDHEIDLTDETPGLEMRTTRESDHESGKTSRAKI